MKLFYSATSPYVRKVVMCAVAREIDQRIERVPVNAHESPAALVGTNPLSKVPTLVTDDGFVLYDSPVICEYLDTVGEALPLYPASGAARWVALRHQALADGMMDAAILRRGEAQKPAEAAREALMRRQGQAVERGIAVLERDVPTRMLDIGTIAIVCALGYLDFRFADDDWRGAAPRLAAWYEAMAEEPAVAETRVS